MKYAILNMHLAKTPGNTKAYVDICFGEVVSLFSVRLIEGQQGLFLGMPSRKQGEQFVDCCRIIDKEHYKNVLNAAIKRYYTELQNNQYKVAKE